MRRKAGWRKARRLTVTPMTETRSHPKSCQDEKDPSALPVGDALAVILKYAGAVAGTEKLALRSALGRVLARPVISPVDVPAHRNSAMDGFALAAADLPESGTGDLSVVGSAYAGTPFRRGVGAGECVRIMTGAKMPEGADTVVIQEEAEQVGERIRITADNKQGQNVREAGEDIAAGDTVLAQGTRIGPAQLGLLASLGIAELSVNRRPRVAIFSSGDELRSLGESLEEGEIYDSNRYTLYGMLCELGVDVIDMGVIRDEREAIRGALEEAAGQADVVLTTGGVSVGEADYLQDEAARLGEILFSKVAIKPGRPLTFGRVANVLFFGLPGNPVAVMVGFYQFVRPALKRLMGEASVTTPTFAVRSASKLKKAPNRTEVQRGVLELDADGDLTVRLAGRQGSGILSSMSKGNCFILLPHDGGPVAPGDMVEVQPFDMLRW